MISFGTRIGENYAWEISLLHQIRDFSDGVSFACLTTELDLYKGDHNPKFTFRLELLNFCVVEFVVYNIHHAENDQTIGLKCPECKTEIRFENQRDVA